MKKKFSTSDFIALGAVIISIIALCKDCSQNKKIDKTNYSLSQIQNKPQIKIIKTEIIGFELHSEMNPQGTEESYLKHDTTDLGVELELNTRIYLTNIGNVSAKIFGEICSDNTSSKRFLREILKDVKHTVDTTGFIKDYYRNIEINNGDTLKIERKFKISNPNIDKFTIHYMLLYENDLDQYFDTYYWARFKLNELVIKEEFYPNEQLLHLKVARKDLINMIKFIDDYNYTDSYNLKEKKELDKYLKK